MPRNFQQDLVDELRLFLAPVAEAADDADATRSLFRSAGWEIDSIPNFPFGVLSGTLANFVRATADPCRRRGVRNGHRFPEPGTLAPADHDATSTVGSTCFSLAESSRRLKSGVFSYLGADATGSDGRKEEVMTAPRSPWQNPLKA